MSTIIHEPTVTTPGLADALERAAWYIEEFGHCKAAYAVDEDYLPTSTPLSSRAVAFCAAGATGRALVELGLAQTSDPGNEGNCVLWAAGVFTAANDGTVWNDDPERTPEEVIQALREAAQKARDHAAVAAREA
jgi:hypothetical protein